MKEIGNSVTIENHPFSSQTGHYNATAQKPDAFGSKTRRVFFGWWTVLATGIIGLWGWGTVVYSFGVLFKPLHDQFGWSRTEISTAGSLRRAEQGIGGISFGWFSDRFGPRAICIIGTFIAGFGYILMYFLSSIWSFYLLYFMVSIGYSAALVGNLDKAIANWFVKRRGLASGIFRVVVALQIMPPVVTLLLSTYGLRMGFVIMGLITWSISFPLAWVFIKPQRPEYYGLLPDGEKISASAPEREDLIGIGQKLVAERYGEVEFTVREAMRTRTFWLLVLSNAVGNLIFPVFSMHLIPYLIDIGMTDFAAASILGLTVTLSIPGRLIGGTIVDRVSDEKLRYIILLGRCLCAFGLFLLLMMNDTSVIYLFAMVYGLGQGITIGSQAPIRAQFFGRKAYSTISGLLSLFALPVSVITPVYTGWMRDLTGSYTAIFTLLVTVFSIGLCGYLFLGPPQQKPTVASDISKIV